MTRLVIFVAVCGAFTAWLAFTIGNIHPFRSTYSLAATFDDVTGLLVDDNVKIAGVVVGKVSDIEVVDGRARVTFEVEDGVEVPRDSEAAVRWRNLLGQRYVYLYPGKATEHLRGGEEVAHTRSVVDLGELFNRLGPIVQAIDPSKVNTFLEAVSDGLLGNEEKARQAIDDLAVLAKALGDRDEALGRLVVQLDEVSGAITARDRQIRDVLDNLLAVATTFNQNTTVLEEAATTSSELAADLGRLLTDNRAHIDGTLDNLTSIVEVIRGKLGVLDATVGGLDETAEKLFASSRHGEWLNQTIPCGKVGYPNPVAVDCVPAASGRSTTGALAVRQLISMGIRG